MGKKSQELYLKDYNSLTAQDLWQPYYQIFLIILLKEFIELNVNTSTMIKKCKIVKSNTKTLSAFLNTKTLK